MKKVLMILAVVTFFISSSADAFIGHSKSYKVESDFGIKGSCILVVYPKSFRIETDDAHFYVPLTGIDYFSLENKTIRISVKGTVMTFVVNSKVNAEKLNHDLIEAMTAERE